jgi:ATP-dependent DNA helicase HFM1/MER3
LSALKELPRYSVTIEEQFVLHSAGSSLIDVELEIQCSVSLDRASSKLKSHKNRHYADMSYILIVTSDLELILFRRTSTTSLQESKRFSVTTQLTKPNQSIWVYMSSVSWNYFFTHYLSQRMQDAIAGVTISSQYKPQIDVNEKLPIGQYR